MAVGDGWTSRLVVGIAELLDASGVGRFLTAGEYAASDVAITDQEIKPDPDRLIAISAYPVTTSPGLADVTEGVQFWLRGTEDPRVVKDLADAVYELLHGRKRFELNGIPIVQSYRQSYASQGQDARNRWERSENYYFEAMRPNINNPD